MGVVARADKGGCPKISTMNQNKGSRLAKLVSIFVCGVQKAGTSSLHEHLREHPALSAPRIKELHFFDNEEMDWFYPDYNWLDAQFSPDDGDKPRLESTPIYAFWPPSIPRIHRYNRDARLIMSFRDPYERAWSQWCMEYARGLEKLPFSKAIREGRKRMRPESRLAREWRIYSYLERGFYAEQVERVLAHFPREQVLFLRSEDLRDNHTVTLARVAAFLGIPEFPESEPKREMKQVYTGLPSQKTEEDKTYVASLLGDDLKKFAQLTGLDVSNWIVTQTALAIGK